MGYLINNGLIQITGTITAAEFNALGTTPYIFSTPSLFLPVSFAITPTSGTTQPSFTSNLEINTISSNRVMLQGINPANVDFYSIFGLPILPIVSPEFAAAQNIELLANNFQLTPIDNTDPTAGDYNYKYSLIGLQLNL
jgi:hypothetical protein